ncbi:MAG TPA: tetratricopeptide repeat protein [Leucothrix mucor]|uniref:Tetratricopeptide repeat protein n=1 Tax=Leucothrix mucor TaxID=45248 RepID=A0A7V2T384_LEUMU|nr:tetratricopeptide repeat protein [Leucothrix mucor]
MKIDSDVIQLLSQIGYLACLKGNVTDGQMIMDSVEINSDSNPAAMIGVAISRIYAGQYPEAARALKKVLNTEPSNMTAKTFLGIALSESGESEEAFSLFKEVVASGNSDNRAVASFYLAEMDVAEIK